MSDPRPEAVERARRVVVECDHLPDAVRGLCETCASRALDALMAERDEVKACADCGSPLTCNAAVHEELDGFKAMFDENINQRDAANQSAEQAEALARRLAEALSALRDKVRAIEPYANDAIVFKANHGFKYPGPTWKVEIDQAEALLASPEVAALREGTG